jgi:hypothetical protein
MQGAQCAGEGEVRLAQGAPRHSILPRAGASWDERG